MCDTLYTITRMERDDRQLIASAIAGDDDAFAFLVTRHLPAVYNFAYRFGGKEEADDIAQETFFKIWKNLKKFRPEENFKTWMFSIARNTTIDYMRKKRDIAFSNFENADGENFLEETLTDTEPLADEIFARAEKEKRLEKFLAKLSPLYREVLILHYQNNFTFEEIGQILKKPLHTIKSQHRRALIILRTLITQDYPVYTG
ncbi:MAG: sigma-70 family RNA polymerase sigma factor [Candidatus Parcubacteria bacterium]|nr:sigma-70 family RNA polymerase sigma factor [Candidatus Parcubacteria bacterium]